MYVAHSGGACLLRVDGTWHADGGTRATDTAGPRAVEYTQIRRPAPAPTAVSKRRSRPAQAAARPRGAQLQAVRACVGPPSLGVLGSMGGGASAEHGTLSRGVFQSAVVASGAHAHTYPEHTCNRLQYQAPLVLVIICTPPVSERLSICLAGVECTLRPPATVRAGYSQIWIEG
jgi:hypothetical protein